MISQVLSRLLVFLFYRARTFLDIRIAPFFSLKNTVKSSLLGGFFLLCIPLTLSSTTSIGILPESKRNLGNRGAFFTDFMTHYYFGQNLNLLNNAQPFDCISLFQYILDLGTHLKKELRTEHNQSVSLTAQMRVKGLFGNPGKSVTIDSTPIKIGWAQSETIPGQNLDKFIFWIREAALTFYPSEHKNTFFKIGLFPFKIGSGVVIGNAYKIEAPIPGQYVYDQTDQFRPAVQLQFGNKDNTYSGNLYLGIQELQSADFSDRASLTNIQNLETPYPELGANAGNVFALFQFNYDRSGAHHLFLSPYFFIQNSRQTIEFPGDATSNLYTPGIFITYDYGALSFSFEFAQNFGHQHVFKWDRNQLFQAQTSSLNTHLFYDPKKNATVETAQESDFTYCPLVVTPASIAQAYGNGANFAYTIPNNPFLFANSNETYIFKNSYDRIRNGYNNTYRGFLAYADMLVSGEKYSFGCAFAYASGDPNPNDVYDTITMTRLTPGITYNDHDKKYKGFLGIDQAFEGKSIVPLFFAQAQKLNNPQIHAPSPLTAPAFTNQAFFGATVRYKSPQKLANTFGAQASVVTYFMPTQITKGLSATLIQEQSIDFTPQMLIDLHTPLPRFLGNEFNFSLDYTINDDLNFSLFGAIFFPGSYYNVAQGKMIPLQVQTAINTPNFSPDEGMPLKLGNDIAFFVSAALTCSFDILDSLPFFKKRTIEDNSISTPNV